jgi:hypothetical protein
VEKQRGGVGREKKSVHHLSKLWCLYSLTCFNIRSIF